ncbi:MAG: methyltransferase domain-containing protein [Leptospirales bacterium]|nr:methyltransferase domain-containing protein [Leptospirales bacterium]
MLKRAILSVLYRFGYVLSKVQRPNSRPQPSRLPAPARKIHYGAGQRLLSGWLNVDFYPQSKLEREPFQLSVDLSGAHPFDDGSFDFAFAEDFLEHLDQKQQLNFLVEAARCLAADGVLRLSFPGLEGVIERHYNQPNFETFARGAYESYDLFEHKHFPARAELQLMAKAAGFRLANFAIEFGKSAHRELQDLDSRGEQIGLNTYVELTK